MWVFPRPISKVQLQNWSVLIDIGHPTSPAYLVKPFLFQCSLVLKQRIDLGFAISMDLMYFMLLSHLDAVAGNSVGQEGDSKCTSSIEMERYIYYCIPLSRNHIILTYYAHPIQRVLTYQILRPNKVRKVLDGICAYVHIPCCTQEPV